MTTAVRIVGPVGGAPLKPEAQARAEINRYIEDFDHRVDGLPKRLEPALVERVLLEKLVDGRPPPPEAQRHLDLADFYDARGVVPAWLEILDRGEATDANVFTAGFFVIGAGVLGDAAEHQRGLGHYHRLVASARVDDKMPLLLKCFDAFTPPETSGLLRGRIEQALAPLRARLDAAGDDEAEGWSPEQSALSHLESLRDVGLQRIVGAAAIEQEVLAELDPQARLDQLARIYVGFDLRYHEHTKRWATRQILRAARASWQTEAIAAFRHPPRVTPVQVAEPEENRRVRAALAIEFLGGELSPEERAMSNPMLRRVELLSLS
ncbi:MAG: hypothetical protein ABJE95_04025 [Byssovorax sp.]